MLLTFSKWSSKCFFPVFFSFFSPPSVPRGHQLCCSSVCCSISTRLRDCGARSAPSAKLFCASSRNSFGCLRSAFVKIWIRGPFWASSSWKTKGRKLKGWVCSVFFHGWSDVERKKKLWKKSRKLPESVQNGDPTQREEHTRERGWVAFGKLGNKRTHGGLEKEGVGWTLPELSSEEASWSEWLASCCHGNGVSCGRANGTVPCLVCLLHPWEPAVVFTAGGKAMLTQY